MALFPAASIQPDFSPQCYTVAEREFPGYRSQSTLEEHLAGIDDVLCDLSSGSGVVGPAGGDLSGTYPNPTVSAIDGIPVDMTTDPPDTNDGLIFNGTAWVPVPVPTITGAGVDNHIVRWDGTTAIQDSQVLITDTGEMHFLGTAIIKPQEKTTGSGSTLFINGGATTDAAGGGGKLALEAGSTPGSGGGGKLTMQGGAAGLLGTGGGVDIDGGFATTGTGGTVRINGGISSTPGDVKIGDTTGEVILGRAGLTVQVVDSIGLPSTATATPTVIGLSDPDTGVGWTGPDQMELVAGGVVALFIDEAGGSTLLTTDGDLQVNGHIGVGTPPVNSVALKVDENVTVLSSSVLALDFVITHNTGTATHTTVAGTRGLVEYDEGTSTFDILNGITGTVRLTDAAALSGAKLGGLNGNSEFLMTGQTVDQMYSVRGNGPLLDGDATTVAVATAGGRFEKPILTSGLETVDGPNGEGFAGRFAGDVLMEYKDSVLWWTPSTTAHNDLAEVGLTREDGLADTIVVILDSGAYGYMKAEQFRAGNGGAGFPGYAFYDDTNSGLYKVGSNTIALATNGIDAIFMSATQRVRIPTAGDLSTVAFSPAGNDVNTGFSQLSGADTLCVVIGGVEALCWTETGGIVTTEFFGLIEPDLIFSGDYIIKPVDQSGAGGYTGQIQGGDVTSGVGSGGSMTLRGGNVIAPATAGNGGTLFITSGAGLGAGNGPGAVQINTGSGGTIDQGIFIGNSRGIPRISRVGQETEILDTVLVGGDQIHFDGLQTSFTIDVDQDLAGDGGQFTIRGQEGFTNFNGGGVFVIGGSGNGTGSGGQVAMTGGAAGLTSGNGGALNFNGGIGRGGGNSSGGCAFNAGSALSGATEGTISFGTIKASELIFGRTGIDSRFVTDQILNVDGAQATPSYAFTNDPGTGIYNASGNVTFSTGGSARAWIDTSGIFVIRGSGTASDPIAVLSQDMDTGLFSPASNEFAITAGGDEMFRVDGSSSPQRVIVLNGATGAGRLEIASGLGNTNVDIAAEFHPDVSLIGGTDGIGLIISARDGVDGTVGAGGDGGLLDLRSANGGDSAISVGNGGAAGILRILGGGGGAANTSGTGGAGASIVVLAGDGGNTSSGTAGNGGDVDIDAGGKGVATGGGSDGIDGDINIGTSTYNELHIGKTGVGSEILIDSDFITFHAGGGGNKTISVETTSSASNLVVIAGDHSGFIVGGSLTLDAGSGTSIGGAVNLGVTNASNVSICGASTNLGFFATSPVAKQTVSGEYIGPDLGLTTALAAYGLITDSTVDANAYEDVIIDEDSTASSSQYDIFADASYPGTLDYTENVTKGITFTPSDGRFTVTRAGIYELTVDLLPVGSTVTLCELDVQVNGSSILSTTHIFTVHSSTDPQPMSYTIKASLTASQYFNVLIDSQSAATITINAGSKITIKRIE